MALVSVEEPDLFNDVEILEVGDFNAESDENYVSVELRSDNDDDEDDCVLLDHTGQFAPSKALLQSSMNTNHMETVARREMIPVQNHGFLSDHEYLDANNLANLVSSEVTKNRITIKVQNSSERFSVPYDEDLGMQDLFNKDNTSDEPGTTTNEVTPYDEYFEPKIEIGDTEIHETIMDQVIIGNELMSPSSDAFDSQDECANIMLSLNSSSVQAPVEDETWSSLKNDHSYTTINVISPHLSENEDGSTDDNDVTDLTQLVTLSNKLAKEQDVSSVAAQKTFKRLERVVKSVRKKTSIKSFPLQQKNKQSKDKPSPKAVSPRTSETDTPIHSLSVVLSTNCLERLEGEPIMVSSAESIGPSNDIEHDDLSTDTECITKQINVNNTEETNSELDKLLSLGVMFSEQCERWFSKTKSNDSKFSVSSKTDKLTHLANIFKKLNQHSDHIPISRRDGIKKSAPKNAEIAIQTDRFKHAKNYTGCDQRLLNEQCKKRLLESASETSSYVSDSADSVMARSSDSDREGDDIMKDFLRRKKRKGRKNNEKRGDGAALNREKEQNDEGKKRSNQIYSDSSSDEQKQSERDAEREENLLEGVLSGVDDIISDVHDIIPDAVGVVQEFLAGEGEKQEIDHPKSVTTRVNDSNAGRQTNGKEKEPNKPVLTKNVSEMTESEREDYYEEMQIERLCNISNLIVNRNAPSGGPVHLTAPTVAKKYRKKKLEDTMEDFLNDENSSTSTIPLDASVVSEESDCEKDVVETEELFLQKCNENMKLQLLNQLSSSEDTSDINDDYKMVPDETSRDGKQNGTDNDESDSSSGSSVEHFLKRQDSKQIQHKERKKSISEQIENESKSNDLVAANGQMSALSELNDGLVFTIDGTSTMNELKIASKNSHKLQLANAKDKDLFNNALFDEENVGKPIQKKRKKRNSIKGSDSDSELGVSSADSDNDMQDHSKRRQRKRITKEVTAVESFDFSASLTASSASRRDPATASSGAKATVITESSKVSKKASSTDSTGTTPSIQSTTSGDTSGSTSNVLVKQKSSKDGQDCISLSSDSSDDAEIITGDLDENKTASDKEPKRKIRAMLTNDELAEETKKAQKEEEGRVARLKKKTEQVKKFLSSYKSKDGESELVLDYDSTRKQAICVHPEIVKLLKPHQAEGIKFMYDNTYGSVDALPKHQGSGCILAHCMGLGKTLQMISLLHTVMRYPQLLTNRVLVICPKSTVMNWKEEIIRWQGTIKTGYQMKVYYFPDVCTQNEKISVLKKWFSCKSPTCGVMLIGYEAFRALINYERRKGSVGGLRSTKLELIKTYLLNPGADLVICDEGHQIKNKRSAISEAVSKIKTRRRIMLTGTPIQNNLKEYYCMVNFIKPSFLGSDKEFSNLYANPIKNGQCKDSDQQAIKIMKQRSYVLHNKLSKFVQRKEAAVLKEFLPEKFEYVLFVPLTPVQEKMYEVFLQMNEYTSNNDTSGDPGKTKKFKLIADYTSLRKIWTHPKVLETAWLTANQEKTRKDAARKTSTPDSYDESPDDNNDIASGQFSVTNDWWRRYLQTADLESLFPSNKLWIMFEILKQCNERGEKCLIFSAFVAVLNVVEHFMEKINNQEQDQQQSDAYAYSAFKGPWVKGKDFYRLDGKTHKSIRHAMITSFNDPQNTTTKCFLISAKAGGQGINLTGANRVIILDTSWNPSNDQQNIFRIFRLGQKRKCYVYRLLAAGTMEEKVYSRSVTKQALSFRVVDEQQIDRHYSYDELGELYTLTKISDMTRVTPILPADDVLASLLRMFPNKIFKYHEHDSLLENKPEQDLSEEDKKEAWAAYEREIQNNENRSYLSQFSSMGAAAAAAAAGGLFGPGYGASMASYYAGLGYPSMAGLPLGGGDIFRNDFSSYGSTLGRSLYMPYGTQQQYSPMLSDAAYAMALAKGYAGFSVPGAGGLDFGLPTLPGSHSASMASGQSLLPTPAPPGSQPGAGVKPYSSTAALANMLSYYSGKSSSTGLPPSLGGPIPPALPTASGSSLAELTAQNCAPNSLSSSHYNPLKQISEYAQGNSPLLSTPLQTPSSSGLTISNITSLHKPGPGSIKPGGSSLGQGVSALLSRLNEQMAASSSPLSSAGLSSPYTPRNVPLLSPALDSQTRGSIGPVSNASSTLPISMITSSTVSNSVSTSIGTTTATAVGNSTPITVPSVISTPPGRDASSNSTNSAAVRKSTETPISQTTILNPAAVSVSGSSATTIIPIDDEDGKDSRKDSNKGIPHHVIVRGDIGTAKATEAKQRDAENFGVGKNFDIRHNTQENNASKQVSLGSGFNDVLKTAKSLISLSQEQPKSTASKIATNPTNLQIALPTPPIISKPSTAPLQMARSHSAATIGNVGTTAQQGLMKAVATKQRQPSPTPKLVSNLKPQPTTSKSSPLSRSPVMIQTPIPATKASSVPAAKGTPAPTNGRTPTQSVVPKPTAASPSMRFVFSEKIGSSLQSASPSQKTGVVDTPKSQPAAVARLSTPGPASVSKSMPKPSVIDKPGQQTKLINPVAVSKSSGILGIQPGNGSSGSASNSGVGLAAKANAVLPKPKIDSRPTKITTLTASPTALLAKGLPSPTNKLLNAQSTPPVMPAKPIQFSTTTAASNISNRKAGPAVKITPVALLSTSSMTGKLSSAPGGPVSGIKATTATPVSVAQQTSTSKPTVLLSNSNRVSPVVQRISKGGVNAVGTKVPTPSPAGLSKLTVPQMPNSSTITTSPTQLSLQPRVTETPNISTASSMTMIPTANIISKIVSNSPSNTTGARPTVSYSLADGARKDLVIRKAVASPTMRRIIPTSQGPQQIMINKLPIASGESSAKTSTTPSSSMVTIPANSISTIRVKPNLPVGGIIRVGNNSNITTAGSSIQPTSSNSMFIRKRGIDATTLENLKAKNSALSVWDVQQKATAGSASTITGAPTMKRSRLEDMNVSTVSSTPPIGSIFNTTNRVVTAVAGVPVKTKSVPSKPTKKDEIADVVVLE